MRDYSKCVSLHILCIFYLFFNQILTTTLVLGSDAVLASNLSSFSSVVLTIKNTQNNNNLLT